MGLEDVGDLAMHMILSKLGPTEVAAVACVGNRFRYWASEDYLWTRFCSQDLNLSSPLNPSGNPSPSFKVSNSQCNVFSSSRGVSVFLSY